MARAIRTTATIPLALFSIALLSGCEDPPAGLESGQRYADPIRAALAKRSADDRSRDASRRPADVLSLAGIAPGMKVVDLMAGGGWYTEALARTVGPMGRVYSHNNAISKERYGSELRNRIRDSGISNIFPVAQELDELAFENSSLDAAFIVQFYHDTYWMEVDRAAMNHAVFASLKPGGVYLVIDHSAERGAGARDNEKLHRIDEDLVEQELRSAGFELVEKSGLLRNPRDDRSDNVFDDRIRGRTDRFILLFRKPTV